MMGLQVQIADGRTTFQGGQTIRGEVSWSLPRRPNEVALELIWTTRGKGTVDTTIVSALRYAAPPAEDRRIFELPLPHAPVSFCGKLVSLVWYLRLVAKPTNEQAQLKIILSPTGQEIDLAQAVASQ